MVPWDDETIQRLLDGEDDFLDPNTPIEKVDAELRRHGLDPERIAADGEDLVRTILGTRIDA